SGSPPLGQLPYQLTHSFPVAPRRLAGPPDVPRDSQKAWRLPMSAPKTRRDFIKDAATTGILAGFGDFAFLRGLHPVAAAEAKVPHHMVQLNPEMEPLVRLIEDTPRNKLLEAVAAKLHQGLSYRNLLAAVLLAGVRGIKPRPVGFKFHAVLVVNSAHLASLASP